MIKNTFQALLREAEASSELAVEEAKIDFALELAKLLERSGMSRSDFAARLGVTLPMVTKILRGDANLTIESMVKATRAAHGVLHLNIAPLGSQGQSVRRRKSRTRAIATIPRGAATASSPSGKTGPSAIRRRV